MTVHQTELKAFCYAPPCRVRRDWIRVLESAPVYGCAGGCGRTREFQQLGRPPAIDTTPDSVIIGRMRVVTLESLEKQSRWNRRELVVARRPFCSCCGLECAMVHRSPVRRCACNPHAMPCPRCSRGSCHCRCRPASSPAAAN